MTSGDLTMLHYFLDVVRRSPNDIAKARDAMVDLEPSPELEKAVNTIADVVTNALRANGFASQPPRSSLQHLRDRVDQVHPPESDDVQREAIGALKLALR
jgi:hypothetical protein